MATQVSNLIFYGPAGTGKTVAAKRRAVAVIDGMAPDDLQSMSSRFRVLVEEERIFAPTLHPSYSYPDWIEGYRPETDDHGQLHWRIRPGVLLEAVAACKSTPSGLTGLFRPGQTITSSTGSSYDVKQVEPGRLTLRRHDQRVNLRSRDVDVYLGDVDRCIERGVRPDELSHSGRDATTRRKRADVARRLDWPPTQLTNSGALRAVYEHVLTEQQKSQPVVLFIDEINRADPGRLWGEAITLLEANRREGQPEEQPVVLEFSRKHLVLPANLHILGTMNSADRSIAQFDVAYRRRFDFIWVGPDSTQVGSFGGVDVPALLDRVNAYLRRELGRDRQVGHAELMQHKLEARQTEHGWGTIGDGELRAVAYVMRTWLVPLLRDLLGNDLVRVKLALGAWDGVVETIDDDLALGDDEDIWVDEREVLDDSGDWWDPHSAAWDAKRVASAFAAQGEADA